MLSDTRCSCPDIQRGRGESRRGQLHSITIQPRLGGLAGSCGWGHPLPDWLLGVWQAHCERLFCSENSSALLKLPESKLQPHGYTVHIHSELSDHAQTPTR